MKISETPPSKTAAEKAREKEPDVIQKQAASPPDAYVAACDALERALTRTRADLERGDALLTELVSLMLGVEEGLGAWTSLLPFHAGPVQELLRAYVAAHPRELRSVPIRRLRSAGLLAVHAFRGDHEARLTDALPAFERFLAVARELRPPAP